jgi:CSLREA domain-containing protein
VTALVVGVALALARGRVAADTTITVTTFADELNSDGDCSLREAVRAANLNQAVDACPAGSSTSADTILIPAGTYTLTRAGADDTAYNGDLDITGALTLSGAGAASTLISGGSGFDNRLFEVITATVQLSGVTLRDGNNVGTGDGGGLNNRGGWVTLINSAVVSNTAAAAGGGLANTGALTLTNTSVLSNTANGASGGGGLYNNGGTVSFTNVTLSGNRAKDNGGGLRNRNNGVSTLTNVTLTNNTADYEANGTGNGGGVDRYSGTVNLKNTIMAGNADNSASTKYPDCSGTMTSQGYNLIQSTTGCTLTGDTTGNITGVSANLGPLADNGGPTLTHALLTGSPALEAGTNSGCPATDQRSVARPQDGDGNGSAVCDMGAYEAAAPAPTPTSTSTATATPTPTGTATPTPTLVLPTDTPPPTGYPLPSTPTPAPTVSSQGLTPRAYLPLILKFPYPAKSHYYEYL